MAGKTIGRLADLREILSQISVEFPFDDLSGKLDSEPIYQKSGKLTGWLVFLDSRPQRKMLVSEGDSEAWVVAVAHCLYRERIKEQLEEGFRFPGKGGG